MRHPTLKLACYSALVVPCDAFDVNYVPFSMADGKKSTKYVTTTVATAISKVIVSIIKTLEIWPNVENQHVTRL
jgi:hypothetical protein